MKHNKSHDFEFHVVGSQLNPYSTRLEHNFTFILFLKSECITKLAMTPKAS